TRKIDQGNENLALLPADRHSGVIDKLRQWEQEREQARRDLERLVSIDEASQASAELKQVVLDAVQKIDEWITSASAAEVRTALGRYVEKVNLHFEPGMPLGGGRFPDRQRHVLPDTGIEITFTPLALHLLGLGARRRC